MEAEVKAKLGSLEIDGTPAEIAAFVASQKQPAKRPIPDHNCDDTYLGCHICAGEGTRIERQVTDDTY
jgi:hypothetical protein